MKIKSNELQDHRSPLLFISLLGRANGIRLPLRLRLKPEVELSNRGHRTLGLHALPHGVLRCFDLYHVWSLASANRETKQEGQPSRTIC
jgi:hypothetical protein